MAEKQTPLAASAAIPPDALRRLGELWITTAEQLVAQAATAGGMDALARELMLSDSETRRMVDAARASLSAGAVAEAERKVDTSKYSLGAAPPKPKRGGGKR